MLLLVTQAVAQMREHAHPNLGRLVTPRHYNALGMMMADGCSWAADNDGFTGVDVDAYFTMLDRLQAARIQFAGDARAERWQDVCLFVTVPDVWQDAAATARLWGRWAPGLRRRGLPLAFVAQDGCERGLTPMRHEFDCLFIGGSDEWRESLVAERLVRAARRAGKWVHFGRVNSRKRMRYAGSIGCDSVDGTQWPKWRHTYLDRGLGYARELTEATPMRLEI